MIWSCKKHKVCKERGVIINMIAFPVLHVVGTPLLNAICFSHEDLELELMDL